MYCGIALFHDSAGSLVQQLSSTDTSDQLVGITRAKGTLSVLDKLTSEYEYSRVAYLELGRLQSPGTEQGVIPWVCSHVHESMKWKNKHQIIFTQHVQNINITAYRPAVDKKYFT